MAGSKRARDVARAKYERQQARRAAQRKKNRRNAMIAAGVTGGVIILGALAVSFWPDGSSTASDTPGPSESTSESAPASAPPAPVPTPANVTCTEATPVQQAKTYTKPGNEKLKAGSSVTLSTNCGAVKITLDVSKAPKTSNSIAFLASKGWYNNNGCHRLTVEGIFVVQCGSPSLDGQGGPGFELPEENLPPAQVDGSINYPAGTVAMANAGKGTGGSQFFLVYKDTSLGADYSIFGHITGGLDVVQYVAAKGVKPGSPNLSDGPPDQPLIIKTATVRNG